MQATISFNEELHYENPKFPDAFNVNRPTPQIQSVHQQIVVHDRILMVNKTFLQRLVWNQKRSKVASFQVLDVLSLASFSWLVVFFLSCPEMCRCALSFLRVPNRSPQKISEAVRPGKNSNSTRLLVDFTLINPEVKRNVTRGATTRYTIAWWTDAGFKKKPEARWARTTTMGHCEARKFDSHWNMVCLNCNRKRECKMLTNDRIYCW